MLSSAVGGVRKRPNPSLLKAEDTNFNLFSHDPNFAQNAFVVVPDDDAKTLSTLCNMDPSKLAKLQAAAASNRIGEYALSYVRRATSFI